MATHTSVSIIEPGRERPVRSECDVVVIGGGVAGVSAALAAAREGARVCLLERGFALGGLATLGLVVNYLPLCDGRGRKVIGGLAERLMHLSVSDGYQSIPAAWLKEASPSERRERYRVCFNPTWFYFALEREVLKAGIELRYDTRFCDVHRAGERLEAVWIEDKGGRAAIRCRTAVDATGDADVAAQCGEPTLSMANNVACGWFYHAVDGEIKLCKFSSSYDSEGGLPEGQTGYAGDIPEDVTAQIVESRKHILEQFEKRVEETPRARSGLLLAPTIPTFRMTRRLEGEAVVTKDDDGTVAPDTLTLIGHWKRRGPVFPIPFRALCAVQTPNLILAGRCISADGDAWNAARAIPACAATGEAAGVAAAHAAALPHPDFRALSVPGLQARLVEHGLFLDPRRLPPPAT